MEEAAAIDEPDPNGSPDAEAFERLYVDNVDGVYSYASARLGATDGEDVTAEVFHAAVVAFRDGREAQVTPAWLMAVTKNKVIDRWRRAERRKAKAHLLLVPQATEWPDGWADGANRPLVMDALERLKPDERVLLILRHVDGMSVPDIAAEAGKSVTAMESKLARARRAFRRHYKKLEARDRA
jgi:RNA polymerase sigma-70 factor (ECF subfamily)